jgi:cytochrome c biogenesis protein CcmG/thiol:disulfide interchange protein DsbE
VPESRARPATIGLILVGALALLALLFVLFVPLGGSPPEAEPGAAADSVAVGGHPLMGKTAPDIDLSTIDGDPVSLSELRGRPVLINFWATWCPPCRDEFPLMVDAYADHANDGLEILGVMHQDFADGARDFAADMGATWPIVEDPGDKAYGDYLVAGLPTSFFVDTEGIVRAFSLGGFSEDGLTAQLETILPKPRPSDG